MRQEVSRRVVALCALAIVAFAFWPSLFGGGSLVSADLVATAPPFDAHRPADFSLENGPGDTIGIHSHWASLADDVRSGDVGWWTPDLAGGQPTLKGGAPVFALPYLVVPDWYAPGLVAAVRTLVAIGLAVGFLRAIDLARSAALVGAVSYGLSGFMVGWMNWPQSSVAAFAPGLLWAVEAVLRRPRPWMAAPIGLMGAAMVWASFPAVLVYLLVAAGIYAVARLWVIVRDERPDRRWWLRVGTVVGVGGLVAVLAAVPFLLGFSEYLDWGDTSYRTGNPDDSAAGVGYLLTAVAPALWGSDAVGPAWFGEGNWVEFNTYVGASVAGLALVGIVAGLRGPDRTRRSIAAGLAAIGVVGVMVAYVGGPVGVLLGDLTGPLGGLMTRAKVLVAVAVAFGAGLGADRIVRAGDPASLRRDLRLSALVAGAGVVLSVPWVLDWYEAADGRGVVRQVVAVSTLPVFALLAFVGVAVARARARCSGRIAGAVLLVVVSVELLAFMMPVPTTVSRSERLRATPAHEVAQAVLEPGERLGGEGRVFFATTAQLFDLPDVRGHLLKSAGYQALLEEVDPDMVRVAGGGTATNPNVAVGTDPRTPEWAAMAVGAWAQFPESVPVGTRLDAPVPSTYADPSVDALVATTRVPDGGLRAVVFEVSVYNPGFVDVAVTTDDGTVDMQRWVEPVEGDLSFALLGEHLEPGSSVRVAIRTAEPMMLVGVDLDGAPVLGRVAGDDGLELVRVGDVTLLDVPAEPAHVVGGAVVEPDPDTAASLVADGFTVIDRDLGVPTVDAGAATTEATIEYGRDEVRITTAAGSPGGVLVVSVADYPGWEATVDGRPVDHATANAAFIGVPVEPGAHDVVLRFRPRRLGIEVTSLVVGLLLAGGLMVPPVRRRLSR